MKKNFNPKKWMQQPKVAKQPTPTKLPTNEVALVNNDIETYITAIEQSGTDITGDYATWRDIGFALAEEYGESGRDYYHRVSKNYSGYNAKECDTQFNNCLKAKGHGITIATFYHHAHQSGIKCNQWLKPMVETSGCTTETKEKMPTFSDALYDTIPDFLKEVVQPASSDEERDIMLLGALTAFSACFPNLFGIYDEQKVHSNLYLFVTAPASAGKGKLNQVKQLVTPIHKLHREQAKVLQQQYDAETASFNMNKGKNESLEKPSKPPERMLFIPANNSATGAYQLISDNEGRGLMFETEGDTLAQAFKSDYGNYSDGFRKAFHHETISYYRRTDREYVDIEKPCLSTILSGTPKQIATLIPNAENGLFSRFIFYYMNIKPVWKDVFAKRTTVSLEEHYERLGNDFLGLYKTLINNPPIEVTLSRKQEQKFNAFFAELQTKYINLQPEEYIATVRRLGLIAFRFAMLFTALRIMEDGDVNKTKECEDVDFDNALAMVKVLVKHSSKVFNDLPVESKTKKRMNKKERFLNSLPNNFTRQDYLNKADELNIPHKTAEGYITNFVKVVLIHRDSHGKYEKPKD
jgi:hypothetical protein